MLFTSSTHFRQVKSIFHAFSSTLHLTVSHGHLFFVTNKQTNKTFYRPTTAGNKNKKKKQDMCKQFLSK